MEKIIMFPDSALLDTEETHVMKQGETLAEIARFYGVTVKEIREANAGFYNGGLFRVGQTILIPDSFAKTGIVSERGLLAFELQFRAKENALLRAKLYSQSFVSEDFDTNVVGTNETSHQVCAERT